MCSTVLNLGTKKTCKVLCLLEKRLVSTLCNKHLDLMLLQLYTWRSRLNRIKDVLKSLFFTFPLLKTDGSLIFKSAQ